MVLERNRKSKKKAGKSYHNAEFNTKLESQGHFDKFEEEMQLALGNIIGSNGAPLMHVVRHNEESSYDPALPHDENITNTVSSSGEA